MKARSQKPEARKGVLLVVSGFWLLASGFFIIACQSSAAEEMEPVTPVKKAETPTPDPRVAEMQVMLAELLDRIEVLNARLQRLESGPASPPVQSTATSTPPVQSTSTSTAAAPAPASRPRPAPPPRPLTGAALAERYRNALLSYGKGELDQSQRFFQEVFDSDPSGDLADNALYWIAEIHFVRAKYSEAMEVYRQIIRDYSDDNKAPDAMLKLGLAYVKLGDLGLARTSFEQLIARYPYSTPASSARAEIKRIQY